MVAWYYRQQMGNICISHRAFELPLLPRHLGSVDIEEFKQCRHEVRLGSTLQCESSMCSSSLFQGFFPRLDPVCTSDMFYAYEPLTG